MDKRGQIATTPLEKLLKEGFWILLGVIVLVMLIYFYYNRIAKPLGLQ
ncbi:MAG TPA: hypothetical protein VJI75_00840 [Candidatus Nanoarchaeia archaeon]|nr:hypothetical protein [Candidatus Nanoarchaeia archaeon]